MLRFIAAILLAAPLLATASVSLSKPIAECAQHLPYGLPKGAKTDTTLICRDGYALEHDNRAKIPAWVSYTLTPKGAVGCEERAGAFKADPSLDRTKRSETKDYAKSGYDIGHMANSADMRSNDQLSEDSNVTSNAAPQLPGLNRAAWKSLEVRTRSWVVGRNHDLLIYVGPIYALKGAKTIGKNQVVVPTGFFKVLVDQKTLEVVAFIYPHEASRATPGAFKTSLAEVQKQTGLKLPLPEKAVLSKEVWPVVTSGTKSKSSACAVTP
jgi:endonuclease G